MPNPWKDAFNEGDALNAQVGGALDLAAATQRTKNTTEYIMRLKTQLAEYQAAYQKLSSSMDNAIDQRDAFREAIARLSPEQREELVKIAADAFDRNKNERKMSGEHGSIQGRNEKLSTVRF